jgi:alpha-1,4-galacturonosyltransferase
MWFLLNPPGKATIHVENVDEFKWLNSSYCPVLRQLESAAMKEYYFKADRPTTLSAGSSNLKYRNPKYLSMLNHLRFYLPQIYPKLDKMLFLDDDIVVQKDLTGLWDVDLNGKVNGAVETCGQSFHRFDKYLNFSNPHIARNFDPNACGWAYGMNIFDLKQWKNKDITGIYHKWQNLVRLLVSFVGFHCSNTSSYLTLSYCFLVLERRQGSLEAWDTSTWPHDILQADTSA